MKELQKAHVGCALRHRYEGVTVVTEVNFADQRRHRRRLRVGRAVMRLSEAGDSRNPMYGIARRRKRIRRIRRPEAGPYKMGLHDAASGSEGFAR